MRIAYMITRADAVGGASVHVRDLAREMQARGNEVLVLLGGAGPVADELARAGVPFRPLAHLRRRIAPWSDARALAEAIAVLREFKPQLVSAHTAKAGWIARAACAALRIPAIYTPHGLSVGARAKIPLRWLARIAERAAGRWGCDVICVAESERRLACENGLAAAGRLHVIHNGVHDIAPEFYAHPSAEPCRIVSVARFEEPKDHRTLLLAVSRLLDLDWEMELAGEGPLMEECQRLAGKLGIAGRVRFLGYQPDLAPLLARGSVFALSSRSEALPRSVLEAMRAGLPIVASDVGGLREMVEHERNGILIPQADAAAFSSAIRRLIVSPPARDAFGKISRAIYEARFRFEFMLQKTLALYRTVCQRAGAGWTGA